MKSFILHAFIIQLGAKELCSLTKTTVGMQEVLDFSPIGILGKPPTVSLYSPHHILFRNESIYYQQKLKFGNTTILSYNI